MKKRIIAIVILVVLVVVAKQTFARVPQETETFKLQTQVQKI